MMVELTRDVHKEVNVDASIEDKSLSKHSRNIHLAEGRASTESGESCVRTWQEVTDYALTHNYSYINTSH